MSAPKFADEAVSALTFPRHGYPHAYLHPQQVHDAFIGNQVAMEGFIQSVEYS
jgi:hypothetical protein